MSECNSELFGPENGSAVLNRVSLLGSCGTDRTSCLAFALFVCIIEQEQRRHAVSVVLILTAHTTHIPGTCTCTALDVKVKTFHVYIRVYELVPDKSETFHHHTCMYTF